MNKSDGMTPAHFPFLSNIWKYIGEQKADLMATLYDVGGIIGTWQHDNFTWSNCHKVFNIHTYSGGVFTGVISDFLDARATSSVIMTYLAVPAVRETPSVHIHIVQDWFLKHRGICSELNYR